MRVYECASVGTSRLQRRLWLLAKSFAYCKWFKFERNEITNSELFDVCIGWMGLTRLYRVYLCSLLHLANEWIHIFLMCADTYRSTPVKHHSFDDVPDRSCSCARYEKSSKNCINNGSKFTSGGNEEWTSLQTCTAVQGQDLLYTLLDAARSQYLITHVTCISTSVVYPVFRFLS